MSIYAKPGACLECRSIIGATEVCPVCALAQTGPEAGRLRDLLTQADVVLAGMRSSGVPDAPQRALSGVGTHAQGWPAEDMGSGAVPATARRRLPAMSTPAILLGLGAACVLVAAIVFVTVNWADLSLAWKAAILLGVTAVFGALGWWSAGKGLRGSAETFSGLFILFVSLDLLAARAGRLAGVESLSWSATRWIAAFLLVSTGLTWSLFGQRSPLRQLLVAQLLTTMGLALLVALSFDAWPFRDEYLSLGLLVPAAVGVIGAIKVGLWPLATGSAAITVVLAAHAFATSLYRVADSSTLHDLWSEGAALGWVVCCLLMAALATVTFLPVSVRKLASAGALIGATLLVLRPLEGSRLELVAGCAAAAALALAFGSRVAPQPWSTGSKLATTPPALLALITVTPNLLVSVEKIFSSAGAAWTVALRHQLESRVTADVAPIVAGAVLLALAACVFILAGAHTPSAQPASLVVVPVLAVTALNFDVSLWVAVSVLAVAAVGTGTGTVAVVRNRPETAVTSIMLAVLTLVAALGSEWTTVLVAAPLGVLCMVLGLRDRHQEYAVVLAVSSVALLGLALAAVIWLVGGREAAVGVGYVVLGSTGLLLAQVRGRLLPPQVRQGFEAGACVLAGLGIALTVERNLVLALCMTLAGAALVAVALLHADRRLASVPGGLLLAGATWVRLWDQDVTTVEAYTLPTAFVLCALAWWRLHRSVAAPTLGVLSPGLSLALLPSLLRTLPDPSSPRAWVVGGCALAVLLGGTYLRWAAPLLIGSFVVLVLAVLNLAPYIGDSPRWIAFAAAGAVLLFLGLTWERRINDLRALGQVLQGLR